MSCTVALMVSTAEGLEKIGNRQLHLYQMWNASCDKHRQGRFWREGRYRRVHHMASELVRVIRGGFPGGLRSKGWEGGDGGDGRGGVERVFQTKWENSARLHGRREHAAFRKAEQRCSRAFLPRNSLFRPCLGSVSKTTSFRRNKTRHWATILAPARNPEEAVWRQVWWELRQCSLRGGLERAILPGLEVSRKLFTALPFPARFETRLRACVFTGPIWRQVFQIKFSSPLSLKDACLLRGGSLTPMLISCCGDKYLNKWLFIWLGSPSVCVWFPAETSSQSPEVSFLKG